MATYTFGSKINYQTIFDINDTLTISFFINNVIFTCGHCLPKQIKFDDPKLSLIYTSGFDTNEEAIELGIIKTNNSQSLTNPYNIKLSLKQLCFSYDDLLYLIHDNIKYSCNYLLTLKNVQFNNLIKFQLNKIKLCDQYTLYFDHQITKLSLNSIYLDLIKMDKIILYKSNHYTKDIDVKYLNLINNLGFNIKTNIFYYLTKPSFSGSPIINCDNIFIGYHIGSTFGFILDELDGQVCWIGKIGYCRMIDFV